MEELIVHSCGHSELRVLMTYQPHMRKAIPIQDLFPAAPEPIQLLHQRQVEKAKAYWTKKLCSRCYREAQERFEDRMELPGTQRKLGYEGGQI